MPECLRCGKCCYGIQNNKPKRCRHLEYSVDGKTTCKVFDTRVGRIICPDWRCGPTEGRTFDYKDCPFNTNKPRFEEIMEKVKK